MELREEDELKNPAVRFEASDINERGVMLAAVGVFASVCLISGLLYFLFAHEARLKAEATPGARPMQHPYGRQLPPEPRLQPAPQRDLAAFKASEEHELHSYHWVDREKGTVAIPIERAMELVAQRGIPRSSAPPPNTYYMPRYGDPLTGFEDRDRVVPR